MVAALGEKRDGAKQALETGEGVEKVVPILAPYKMASKEMKKERSIVPRRGRCRSCGKTQVLLPTDLFFRRRDGAEVIGGPINCGHYVPEEAPEETLAWFLRHFT